MSSTNETEKIKAHASTPGEAAGSPQPQAEEGGSRQEFHKDAVFSQNAQESDGTEDIATEDELVDSGEDVVGEFLSQRGKRATEYVDIIESMLGQHNAYSYAEPTLIGILDFIERENCITEAQIRAIENIKSKPSKGR